MWQSQIGKVDAGSCLFRHGPAGRVAAPGRQMLAFDYLRHTFGTSLRRRKRYNEGAVDMVAGLRHDIGQPRRRERMPC